MSLIGIKSVFENLESCTGWSLQLLNIKVSKRTGIGYSSRQISLSPSERIMSLIRGISQIYGKNGKKDLSMYEEVRDYDGTANNRVIYRMNRSNRMICSEYELFLQTIAEPDVENDPFKYESAYLLCGLVMIDGEMVPVKLISMQNPTTSLKNKYVWNQGVFKDISDKVLSLRAAVDVVILGETVYFLTLAGENLFNMPRAYKEICQQKVEIIRDAGIVNDIERLKRVALSGQNPRQFVLFNDKRLEVLKKKRERIKYAKMFSIPLDASGNEFDVSIEGTSEKLVKFLCNKGMLDPIEQNAVEVDGAKKWS